MHHVIYSGLKLRRTFWFTSFDENYLGFVTRYALLTGQALAIHEWIFGFLSNFKHVCRRGIFLAKLARTHNFKRRERKFISKFSGLLRMKRRVPFAVFIVRLDDFGIKVSVECGSGRVVSTALVDSDNYGTGVTIPIPGNDDSLICVLFYLRFIANLIFFYKMKLMRKWRRLVYKAPLKLAMLKSFFFNLILKRKRVNYRKLLFFYGKDLWYQYKMPYWKTINIINMSGQMDAGFVVLDSLLPRKVEKYKNYVYAL